VSVVIEKGEGLEDNGDRGVKPRAGLLKYLPMLAGACMQRIARERQRDPCTAIDEGRFALPH
jgi:hypothetical protein